MPIARSWTVEREECDEIWDPDFLCLTRALHHELLSLFGGHHRKRSDSAAEIPQTLGVCLWATYRYFQALSENPAAALPDGKDHHAPHLSSDAGTSAQSKKAKK